MKMKYIFAVLALAAIAFSACSQKEDITSPLVGQAINATFSVGGAQTRVNTLDEQANKWEDGDMIKAKVTGGGKTSKSVLTATVSENGAVSWSHHKNFVWQDNGKHKVYVSYPSDYPCDESGKWTLPLEQNTLKGLKGADFIDGSYEGDPYNHIKIQAAHRLALVTVTYEIGTADFAEGTTLENPVVKSPYDKFSITDGKVIGVTGSSGVVEVKAYKHEDANKFSAIIVPGTLGKDSEFLSFSVGEKNYVSKLKSPTDFVGGTCYTYSLKVGKNKVELTQINVEGGLPGWGSEEELK